MRQIVLGIQDLLDDPNINDPAQSDAYAMFKCVIHRLNDEPTNIFMLGTTKWHMSKCDGRFERADRLTISVERGLGNKREKMCRNKYRAHASLDYSSFSEILYQSCPIYFHLSLVSFFYIVVNIQ